MADKEKVVGEISSFLSQSARQLETLLHKLKWSKGKLLKEMNSSKVVHCPLNSAHRVPESRLEKHSKVCQYNSIGMNPQDAPYSQEFFYQTCKAVIPVFIDNSTLGQELTMIKEVQDKLTQDKNKYSDSVAEIRSIMEWETIPASHRKLQFHLLSEQKIRDWIIGNLPQVQYLSSVEGASDRLVNFVLSCLQEKEVAHPDGMEEMLKDLLGSETQSFVVNLWKFLAVSIAEGKYESAVEHDVKKEISLTMDRVKSELPPQQRLAVYEHVVQVANAKREVQREEELEMDSKVDESKDEDNDQPKSRYELLAEQRDYKRRRQSYRAKNVHITKRSAVEVMRDLIETQMHVLEMQFKDERGASGNNSNEEDASSEGKESWGSKTEQMDYARRESRDDEGRRGTERDRRKHRDGSKRVRFYDDRETDSKRPRR